MSIEPITGHKKKKLKHTHWKKVKNCNLIGKRFFEYGDYGISGYFTVIKAYKCREYFDYMTDEADWFHSTMVIIKTDSGLKYKVPFFPWAKVTTEDGKTKLCDLYERCPW